MLSGRPPQRYARELPGNAQRQIASDWTVHLSNAYSISSDEIAVWIVAQCGYGRLLFFNRNGRLGSSFPVSDQIGIHISRVALTNHTGDSAAVVIPVANQVGVVGFQAAGVNDIIGQRGARKRGGSNTCKRQWQNYVQDLLHEVSCVFVVARAKAA